MDLNIPMRKFLEPTNRAYREVKIPKGGYKNKFRTLHIPNPELQWLQKILLTNLLYRIPVSPAAHCSVPGRSTITNILPHLESRSYFRLDFKDAFPTVNKEMVSKHLALLIKEKFTNCDNPESVATIVSELTTYKNALPQGAPTSPYLLNLVCCQLDNVLLSYLRDTKQELGPDIRYTRYADDCWFSSPQRRIPAHIRSDIVDLIQAYGFTINREKVLYKTGTATVPKITGVTIVPNYSKNEEKKMSISRKTIEQYRTIIHQAITNHTTSTNEVLGMIAYVTMITKELPNRLKNPFKRFLYTRCPEKVPKFQHLL